MGSSRDSRVAVSAMVEALAAHVRPAGGRTAEETASDFVESAIELGEARALELLSMEIADPSVLAGTSCAVRMLCEAHQEVPWQTVCARLESAAYTIRRQRDLLRMDREKIESMRLQIFDLQRKNDGK